VLNVCGHEAVLSITAQVMIFIWQLEHWGIKGLVHWQNVLGSFQTHHSNQSSQSLPAIIHASGYKLCLIVKVLTSSNFYNTNSSVKLLLNATSSSAEMTSVTKLTRLLSQWGGCSSVSGTTPNSSSKESLISSEMLHAAARDASDSNTMLGYGLGVQVSHRRRHRW